MHNGALRTKCAAINVRFFKNRESRNAKEEKSISSRMVKGRPTDVENDGAGQTGRQEDRQSLEANSWRNACDGS
jgi:hypothetical protein